MPIYRSNFTTEQRTTDPPIETSYGPVVVTYNPAAITGDLLDSMRGGDENDVDHAVQGILAEVLISWDVMDGDGPDAPMWPVDLAGLKRLPVGFLVEIIHGLQGDASPGKAKEKPSGHGSKRKR